MGSHSLFQGIFPTQGLNPGLPHCRWILYQLSYKGSPPTQHGRSFFDKHVYIITHIIKYIHMYTYVYIFTYICCLSLTHGYILKIGNSNDGIYIFKLIIINSISSPSPIPIVYEDKVESSKLLIMVWSFW